jgi:hypothetical protein
VFGNVAKKRSFFEMTETTHPKTQVYIPEDLKSQRHVYEDPKPHSHRDAIQVRIMNSILHEKNFYQTPNYDTDWTNWTHEKGERSRQNFNSETRRVGTFWKTRNYNANMDVKDM